MWSELRNLIGAEHVGDVLRAVATLVLGLVLASAGVKALRRALGKRVSAQHVILLGRLTYYGLVGLIVVTALGQLGVDLSLFVGAAGLLTVAIGFASQTSASNVIGGLFLIAEEPFVVGDTIQVGGTTGIVESQDLLSVKLRTFDNLYVRVPNEILLKAEITNLSHYPIRRYDMLVGVAYEEDLGKARAVLLEVADRNPLSLSEPKPLIIFQGFDDSAVTLQFSVWAARDTYLDLRNSISEEVKLAFAEAGIEFPFPHRTLHAGSPSKPFPVRIVPPGEPEGGSQG